MFAMIRAALTATLLCLLATTFSLRAQSEPMVKYVRDLGDLPDSIVQKSDNAFDKVSILLDSNEYPVAFKLGKCRYAIPTVLQDLHSGFLYNIHVVRGNMNVSLEALGFGTLDGEQNNIYVIIEFWQKRIFECEGHNQVHYGAGGVALLHIRNAKSKLELNLPKLAMAATQGTTEVTFSLRTYGLSGQGALFNTLPDNVTFTIENYSKFTGLIETVRNLYAMKDITVVPQRLPYPVYINEKSEVTLGFNDKMAAKY